MRRHPITTAFKFGYFWHISNNDAFTVPQIVTTLILYCCSHFRMNSSISSNGLSGWMYKQSNCSFGKWFVNKLMNICNSTVQSLPPLNDKKISFASYVSSVLLSTCKWKIDRFVLIFFIFLLKHNSLNSFLI